MTPLALWAAVALVALVATLLWSILARETGIYVTAGVSFVGWSWISITGGDVALANAGDPIWMRQTTASLQYVALALAIISLIVFAMRLLGSYPSPENNAAETEQSANRSSNH